MYFKNASSLNELSDESIDLMVTSPPYPMIEMWDTTFSELNPKIEKAFSRNEGMQAFEIMHQELDEVWKETYRVLKRGGFACINIGDATRRIDNEFRLYPNHSRILNSCLDLGFYTLPEIIWRKETNAPNKFMGSGMLPAGAYVTLEHEFILILRKGGKRIFETPEKKLKRRQSALFWEERNSWFSDVWQNLKGAKQTIDSAIRDRSGAYPFELPYRIINMFSVREDTVLDPFLGTGTTTLAAVTSGRNSVGFEIDSKFKPLINKKLANALNLSNRLIKSRIEKHIQFVKERSETKQMRHFNKVYGFPVMTGQEVDLSFKELKQVIIDDEMTEVNYV
jgi:DNA modification methylase